MKTLSVLMVVALLLGGANVFATNEVITDLPCTVGVGSDNVFFDLDEDGEYDFYVQVNGSVGNEYVGMYSRWSSSGQVYEYSHTIDESKLGPERITTIFDEGEEIDDGHDYSSNSHLVEWNNGGEDAKQDTYLDGKTEGYVGCRIAIFEDVPEDQKLVMSFTGQYRYAWMHVIIDNNAKTVTFQSSGYKEAYDEPITAGDAPVVPIPVLASVFGFGVIGIAAMRKRFSK